jgi:hypothetical protein
MAVLGGNGIYLSVAEMEHPLAWKKENNTTNRVLVTKYLPRNLHDFPATISEGDVETLAMSNGMIMGMVIDVYLHYCYQALQMSRKEKIRHMDPLLSDMLKASVQGNSKEQTIGNRRACQSIKCRVSFF